MHDDHDWDFERKRDHKVTIKEYGFWFWYFYSLHNNLLFYFIHSTILAILTSLLAVKCAKMWGLA